ncbi:M20 metallopeptidase family protein [Clostridium swellfunianum]|uniref:M20 metallopeptidase family protein n=1 Tax=Clostridium swellfunianum TaxID=1367462 RepID=UPI0020305C8F|nr:amidohydrolase [Clostridium swellfunianum]
MRFKESAARYEDYIIELRRHFHRNPELSFKEVSTSEVVCKQLEKMKIPYVCLEENCVVGLIEGNEAGKSLAIRADMDALPIEEETGLSFASQTKGIMHACGHDGHTAMLLGAAAMINEVKEELEGKVYLCFQSAEEIWGGAKVVIDYLERQGGVDEAISAHLWADIESGNISVVKGARMASADGFEIEVMGRGGHGSRPDQCIDPIRAASNIVLGITSIPTNRYKATEPLVVHVGAINAGSLGNIIPKSAKILGGIRSFSQEGKTAAWSLIHEIAENGAKMYGAEAKVTILGGVPSVVNHSESVERAQRVIDMIDVLKQDDYEPICASENFGMYMEKYKGFMAFIGIRNKNKGLIYPQHHPKFDIDEAVLKEGARFFAEYAYNFLDGNSQL